MGYRTLENYKGFVDERLNKETLQRLIESYTATHTGPDMATDMTSEELSHHSAMWTLVADYPVNAVWLIWKVIRTTCTLFKAVLCSAN